MEKITIYTQSTCGYCNTVKEELTKNNMEFEVKLIGEFEDEWDSVTSLTKMPTTPTVYYKNNYFLPSRDFVNPQALIGLLKNFKESKFSLPHRNNEAIKTLNYNMAMAFNRVDQLLRKIETKLNTENEYKSNN
jgi:glutaredoxin|tara:strand:- start:107 stop:505 length:399 start_codon:yes stop_codon:yes gene_type:complete